ncbi:hypothetical protein RRF57_000205 [Xylaria bambusicola]|uniref:Uncharacterized protein n=1 Tax=Xylaria bambusicola TaxID=326684 RepID=A0AAN7Z2A7_9PEZI
MLGCDCLAWLENAQGCDAATTWLGSSTFESEPFWEHGHRLSLTWRDQPARRSSSIQIGPRGGIDEEE